MNTVYLWCRRSTRLLPVMVLGHLAVPWHGNCSDSVEPAAEGTLASPGSFTNVVFDSRSISPDGKWLTRERYWVQNGNIRILAERVPNENGATSLTDVADDVWLRVQRNFELIKTASGAFIRQQPSPEWGTTAQRIEDQFRGSGRQGTLILKPPEDWRTLGPTDKLLSFYTLTIDGDIDLSSVKTQSFNVGQIVSLKSKLPDVEGSTNRFLEVEFDSRTRLKLQRREWDGGRLIQQAAWRTDAAIDPAQFEIPKPELYRPYRGKKLAGIGAVLERAESGPFKIAKVVPGSPAERAGLKLNSLLIGIGGKTTKDMPLREAVELLRGDPGTSVSVEMRTAAGQTTVLSIEREIISGSSGSVEQRRTEPKAQPDGLR